MADQDDFGIALRQARVAEAAQLEAVMNIRDARTLRLESLRDAVQSKISGDERALALFELVVQPSVNPKLWIDLISSVIMEPNPRSFRLIQDREKTSEIVFETTVEAEMVKFLTQYLAHRLVLHDKAVAGAGEPVPMAPLGYSLFDMIYVWATGCLFGVLILVTIAMYLGKLHF